jgi:hypothetical protein
MSKSGGCSVLKVIASRLQMVAMDFTIAPLSPGFVDGLSPTTMSFQEIFLGSTSFDEMTLNCFDVADVCSTEAETVAVGIKSSVADGHEKHLLQ